MNKKKVGIITLIGYFNYGNKLQNYAVTEVMKSLDFDPATVVIQKSSGEGDKSYGLMQRFSKLSGISIKDAQKRISNKIHESVVRLANKNAIDGRKEKFKEFSKLYLNEKVYSDSKDGLEHLADEYDYFVTGSDQVWNPFYINNSSNFFIQFADKSKRIAYSPSFGISEIPEEFVEDYRERLSEMHRLSTREQAGADIVKKLTGRDAHVLVDPTIMLSKEQWLSIAKPSKYKPKGKYLLTYFLGEVSKENQAFIDDIAEKNKLEIVNLADIKDVDRYIDEGPSEFIDYINSASLFLTDSFHGVVFSILMETPSCVFSRAGVHGDIYSRIETLLNMFNLKHREVNSVKASKEIFEVDYSHIPPILEREREKAMDYLKEALGVVAGATDRDEN